MKKTIFNNLGLKIISVFIAFLIWLMVVNGDDPERTKTFSNIKVTAINEESFIEADKVWDVKDSSNVVTVKVRARRSVLGKLSADDFTVVADLEHMTFLETVPLIVTCSNPAIQSENIVGCDPPSLKITVEDKEEKTFMISVGTEGQPATGYEVGIESVKQGDSVIIEGPSSLINIIDNVKATIKVTAFSTDQTIPTSLVVIDKNGTDFNESQMDRLIFKTTGGRVISDALVDVRVTFWEVQSIKLEVGTAGEPAPGYIVTDIIPTPTSINLAGAADTLAELEGKLILEDLEEMNITGLKTSVERSIDISDYLLDHYKKMLKLETNAPETISVKIQIEEIGTTTLNIPTSDVNIKGQPEDMDMTLTPADKIPIEFRALTSNAALINAKDIKAELDLTSYQTEGNYKVQLKITPPPGYELVNDVTIAVNLAKKQNTIVEES